MTYLNLFIEFFKTGLFSIGGGLATIPFLNSIADRYDWFDRIFLSNIIAVAESTPGPIGVNVATYAGFTAGASDGGIINGVLGGIVSTCSLVLPSFLVIMIVAKLFESFKENKLVKNAFYGVRPATAGMVASVTVGIIKTAVLGNVKLSQISVSAIDVRLIIMFAVLLVLTNKVKLHPIVYIAVAGLAGALMKL